YPAARGRAWDAALIFAIAGWLGSALGIGMAQDLSRVPSWFALPAAVFGLLLLLGPTLRRPAGSVVVILALLVIQPQETCAQGADVLRGRDVYIAEGCIHCHSQYLRPETPDTARWGAALPLDAALAGTPPLLGNRRQGPDLSRVGQRRTPEWNRLHLIAPRSIVPGSRMPSYAHLFRGAGDDGRALLAYLSALGTAEDSQRSPGAAAAPRSRATGLAAGTETVHTAP